MLQSLQRILSDTGVQPRHQMTEEEWQRHLVDQMNSEPGTKDDGIDCPDCLNRGYYFRYDEQMAARVQVPCHCLARREARRRLDRSGLGPALRRMTFATYQADDEWQRRIYAAAKAYAATPAGWFLAGGQVGSGKTHICTAILQELSLRYPVRYMLWRDESARIKALLNEPEGVERMRDLKTAPVLYIDDLFKGAERPTQGDLNIAFELLNYRYNDERLYTIISTEKLLDELIAIDEAIGSRIAERSKGHRVQINRDPSRNWRTR